MKKKLRSLLLLMTITYASFSQVVGIGTAVPDPSAALDITSANKGLLIPRMNTAGINVITSPGNGLLVYDNQTNQLKVNIGTAVAPNFQPVSAGGTGWNLTGNNGIDPALQFIGSTDNQALHFRVNNIQAGELHPLTGNVFWGLRAGSANTAGFSNIAIGTGALLSNRVSTNLVAVGDSALFNNGLGNPAPDEASFNTAIGSKSMFANTTGTKNTALGYQSLFSNQNGGFNTAVGFGSLFANTTGNSNTSIGFNALSSNITGTSNTAIGNLSLFSANSNFNTAIGDQALFSNNTGHDNTAVGFGALAFNSTASSNTAIGSLSLKFNATGVNNTAIGFESLTANTTGFANTAAGFSALSANSTGTFNTAVGDNSLHFNTTGADNTAVGDRALFTNSTGNQNTALGTGAGQNFSNGTFNVFVGASADALANDLTNCVAVGRLARCTASNQVRFGNSTTSSIGGIVGYTNLSDGRYKKNIQEGVKGLDFIMKLRPVTYQLDINGINQRLGLAVATNTQAKQAAIENETKVFSGFVAQEVEQSAKAIGYDFSGIDKPRNENDMYGLRYAEFVVPLVKAMQEQQQTIVELKIQNADLQKRVLALEKK